jgi:hypothetical protein
MFALSPCGITLALRHAAFFARASHDHSAQPAYFHDALDLHQRAGALDGISLLGLVLMAAVVGEFCRHQG